MPWILNGCLVVEGNAVGVGVGFLVGKLNVRVGLIEGSEVSGVDGVAVGVVVGVTEGSVAGSSGVEDVSIV